MPDCYVYYRIDARREGEAKRALDAMLVALHAATGVAGRTFSKTHEPLLWMEVYSEVADTEAFIALLTQLAATHGLAPCLADNEHRHVEQFTPLLRQDTD